MNLARCHGPTSRLVAGRWWLVARSMGKPALRRLGGIDSVDFRYPNRTAGSTCKWPKRDFHRSSALRPHPSLSGRIAQHDRLDLQALCVAAQHVVQRCHVLRARSLGTGQVQGVTSA